MPKDERHKPPRKRPSRDRATKPQPETPAKTAAATLSRQRIAKAMARAGLCSRRTAEAWITDGRVSVNGVTLTSPAVDVGGDDAVLVDGQPLPEPERTRLFLFHKPRGLVTSDHDPEGRPTVADYLRENWPEGPRVMTIGRLDINTEGLLLLTNDGGLARALELPETGWTRRYRVRAKGTTDQARLDTLRDGLTIDGVAYLGVEAILDRIQGANCWLTIALREGKNREVKKLLEHVELEVNRLIRLSFGPFQLFDLPEGAVEEVRQRVLSDQLGPELAARLGVTVAPRETPPRPQDTAPPVQRERQPARRGQREPRSKVTQAPQERRERPTGTPRKHVSTMRDEAAASGPSGSRRRIDRSATTDRRDRTVQVERVVAVKPAGTGRDGRRRDQRPPHASPSARAKRERIARSGAPQRESSQPTTRWDARDPVDRGGDYDTQRAKPARLKATGPKTRADRRGEADTDGHPNRTAAPAQRSAGGGKFAGKRLPGRRGPRSGPNGGPQDRPRPGPKRSGNAPRRPPSPKR